MKKWKKSESWGLKSDRWGVGEKNGRWGPNKPTKVTDGVKVTEKK